MSEGAPSEVSTGSAPALWTLDLNLLVAFEALYAERHVTRAARRLGLSQSAMSGVLARLRTMLDDALFVRTPGGIEPTARAHALAGPVARSLQDLRAALTAPTFDAATSEARLTIGAVDAVLAVVLPTVAARVMREAPGVRLEVVPIDPGRAVEMMDGGRLDVALAVVPTVPLHVGSRGLFAVDPVVAMRPGHPLAGKVLTLDDLAAWPHVMVSYVGAPRGKMDEVLDARGTPRRVAVVVPSFLAVAPMVAASDALAVLPGPFAASLARAGTVVTAALPEAVALTGMTMRMLWPLRSDADPASRWLRGLVVEAVAAITSPPAPLPKGRGEPEGL